MEDRAEPGREEEEFSLDKPGERRGVGRPPSLSSLRMVRVGTRSVRRLWAEEGVPGMRPSQSPSLLLSSPCALAVLLARSSGASLSAERRS